MATEVPVKKNHLHFQASYRCQLFIKPIKKQKPTWDAEVSSVRRQIIQLLEEGLMYLCKYNYM